MFKEIIKPSLILFVVCAVITGALAYVNGVTEPIIEENQRLAKQEAMKEVLPDAQNFSEPISADNLKSEGYPVSNSIRNLYEATDTGFVVEAVTAGYGGEMTIMVGINIEKNVTGVKLTSHSETPGLGAKAANADFVEQYYGPIPDGGFAVVKGVANSDGEVQAVSGATISSRALTQGVSDAVKLVNAVIDGFKEEQKDPKQVVLPDAESFSDPISAEQLKADGYEVSDRIINLFSADGFGHVVEVITDGYKGPIKMMVGFDSEVNITNIKIIEHSETSGLGSEIENSEFLEQYKGTVPEQGFKVVTRETDITGEIQAVSHATISSVAVTRGIADAAVLVSSLTGGA